MKLLGSLRKKGGHSLPGMTSPEPARDIWEGIDEPLLVLLAPDAAGRASYQLNTFSSTEAAQAFFRFWTLDSGPANCIAFWALSYPPRDEGAAEPIVMIREKAKVNRVYPFSFSDLENAYAFVRTEAECGPPLSDMLVYWAARLEIREEDGEVRMIPTAPPPVYRHARRQGPLFRLPTVIVEKTGNTAPASDLPTAAEMVSAAEAAVAAHRPAPVPEPQAPDLPPEPQPETTAEVTAPEPAADLASPPARPRRKPAARKPRKAGEAAAGASTHEDVVPAPVIEAAIQIVTERSRKTNGRHPPEEAVVIEMKPKAPTDEPASEPAAQAPEAPAADGDEPPETHEPPETDSGWLISEMERFTNRQRWTARNEPFRGFDSPPGRF